MTGREAQTYIGREFYLYSASFQFRVRVDDWKTAYGRDLFLVMPVAGNGSAWVSSSSLRAISAEKEVK